MRLSGKRCGGRVLFVKSNFKFAKIDVVTVMFESVFIEIFNINHKTNLIIGAIYRLPNDDLYIYLI